MKTITHKQLETLLLSQKSASFVTLKTVTEAQKSKAKAAQVVLKESHIQAIVRYSYENAVNNQEKREGMQGTFQVSERKWGKRVENTHNCPVIHHTNKQGEFKRYASFLPQKVLTSSKFYVDGNEVSKESVKHLLPTDRPSNTQSHLDKQVKPRDYAFDSIHQINIQGEQFRVVPK